MAQRSGTAAYAGRIEVRTEVCDDTLTIRIRDNCVSVSADDRDEVFTHFFMTKPTGGRHIGLGLRSTGSSPSSASSPSSSSSYRERSRAERVVEISRS